MGNAAWAWTAGGGEEPAPAPAPAPGGGGTSTDGCSVEVMGTDGTAAGGYTTIKLKCELPAEATNVYVMAGTSEYAMSFPAAFQVPAPFGSDVGGPNPAFIAFNPDVEWDSYLCVGSETDDVSVSPGPDGADAIAAWGVSESVGFETSNAAVFYMDPNNGAAAGGALTFAQLTVPDATYSAGGSAQAGLTGRTADTSADWSLN